MRTPARRAISVSMSPSTRERLSIWPASQSVGSAPSFTTWPNTRAQRRVWVSSASLRKSGIWQASHSSRSRRRPSARRRISGSRASAPSVSRSEASLPRTSPGPGGAAFRLSSSPSRLEKSRSPLRQQSWSSDSKLCASTAATTSSGIGRGQPARPMAVELAQPGEGHVVDVHVEAHADRVRGDQEVDLLLLVEGDLGVAGARAEPAHDHGAAAPAAADQFRQRIDLGRAERDDGAARRQAHELGRTGIGELRQAGPRLHARLRHQALQQRADRLRAQEHGLDHPARMQQPVGEDMAAIRIGAQLDLVHRHELDRSVERHGLHGAGEPARLGRDDLLLAGDQRDEALPLRGDHAVVVLAGEQAEREADDARGMRQQPLDREMRLAGVGRAEDGFDARCETGIEAAHAGMVGCCGAKCKRDGEEGRMREPLRHAGCEPCSRAAPLRHAGCEPRSRAAPSVMPGRRAGHPHRHGPCARRLGSCGGREPRFNTEEGRRGTEHTEDFQPPGPAISLPRPAQQTGWAVIEVMPSQTAFRNPSLCPLCLALLPLC